MTNNNDDYKDDIILRQDVIKAFESSGDWKGNIARSKAIIKDIPTAPSTDMIDKSNFSKTRYRMDTDSAWTCGFVAGRDQLNKRLESLKSEYNAYHLDNDDYWRGVKHAIEIMEWGAKND